MAKSRFKRKKPKTTGHMGMTPVVYWTEEGARNANDFMNKWPDRVERGKELVLLEAAGIMRTKIQSFAPEIGGEKWADKLEVVLVKGSEMEHAVAVVYPQETRDLKPEEEDDTALFVKPSARSPDYVEVLENHSPWTADLLPVALSSKEATVVARRATQGEIQRIHTRILGKRSRIERELRNSGLRDSKITQDSSAAGTEVIDDLAFSVLRFEFGVAGPARPHWRPALKEIQSSIYDLGRKFIRYVQDGKESVFSVPEHGSVTAADLMAIQDFQSKIASAAGL